MGSKPKLIARALRERDAAEDKKFYIQIGAAWPFKEGDGYVVRLHSIPTDWDGHFLLVPPKEDDDK